MQDTWTRIIAKHPVHPSCYAPAKVDLHDWSATRDILRDRACRLRAHVGDTSGWSVNLAQVQGYSELLAEQVPELGAYLPAVRDAFHGRSQEPAALRDV